MARIRLDSTAWPVPVVTPEGVVSPAELEAFFHEYSSMLRAHREPYALVIDLRRSPDMPAAQRKVLTNFMREQALHVGTFCAGTGLVFESALMQAMLTAIFWIRRPPQEVRVFTTVEEARSWARQVLAQRQTTPLPRQRSA